MGLKPLGTWGQSLGLVAKFNHLFPSCDGVLLGLPAAELRSPEAFAFLQVLWSRGRCPDFWWAFTTFVFF